MPVNPLDVLGSSERAINKMYTPHQTAGDAITAFITQAMQGYQENKRKQVEDKDAFLKGVRGTTYNELLGAAKAGDEQAQLQLDQFGEQMGLPVVNYVALNKRQRQQELDREGMKYAQELTRKQDEKKLEHDWKKKEFTDFELPKIEAQSQAKIDQTKSKPPTTKGKGPDLSKLASAMNALNKAKSEGALSDEIVAPVMEFLMQMIESAAGNQGSTTGGGKQKWE